MALQAERIVCTNAYEGEKIVATLRGVRNLVSLVQWVLRIGLYMRLVR